MKFWFTFFILYLFFSIDATLFLPLNHTNKNKRTNQKKWIRRKMKLTIFVFFSLFNAFTAMCYGGDSLPNKQLSIKHSMIFGFVSFICSMFFFTFNHFAKSLRFLLHRNFSMCSLTEPPYWNSNTFKKPNKRNVNMRGDTRRFMSFVQSNAMRKKKHLFLRLL